MNDSDDKSWCQCGSYNYVFKNVPNCHLSILIMFFSWKKSMLQESQSRWPLDQGLAKSLWKWCVFESPSTTAGGMKENVTWQNAMGYLTLMCSSDRTLAFRVYNYIESTCIALQISTVYHSIYNFTIALHCIMQTTIHYPDFKNISDSD